MGSRFPCLTPLMERFYLDLPQASKNRVCTLEVECGYLPRSWVRQLCNIMLV